MTSTALRLGKRLFKGPINSLGMDVVRRVANNGPTIPCMELFVEHDVMANGRGAILQVGANDGTMDDPVHKVIKRLGLPAVLVEPLPDVFGKLKESYADCPGIRFENCAVSTEPGTATIYRVRKDAKDLPDWAQGIASFDKNVLLSHRTWDGAKDIGNHIEELPVPVLTVTQLLAKHVDIGRFTALQVDTEGHDYVVVKAAMEAGFKPRIVAYEHKHLSFADQERCRTLLEGNGYAFMTLKTDTVAYRAN